MNSCVQNLFSQLFPIKKTLVIFDGSKYDFSIYKMLTCRFGSKYTCVNFVDKNIITKTED
jgi:hypothetical protein